MHHNNNYENKKFKAAIQKLPNNTQKIHSYIKIHSSQERLTGTQVRYLHDWSSSQFQPLIIQKVLHLFLPNLCI